MACGRSTLLLPTTSRLLFSTHSCRLIRLPFAHPIQTHFLHSFRSRLPHSPSPSQTAQMSRTSRASPSTSLAEAQDLFRSSNRILALCGAGLSAASGLPTFRGSGGLWRNHDPIKLANAKAFKKDPVLVWLFYAWRRHLALSAQPNGGHYALAELAKRKKNFLCLTQNVDCGNPSLAPFVAHESHTDDIIQVFLPAPVTPRAASVSSTAACSTSSASTTTGAATSRWTTSRIPSAPPSSRRLR